MVRYHYMRGLLRKINRKVGSNMLSFSFAERVQNLNPSAIREILKYSADPEVVGLSAGTPAPEAFPLEVIADISSRIFRDRPIDALQYGTTEGYGPLRERLKAYLKQKHGIGRAFDELLITSGAQQAIELVAKVLCNPGDVVLCESPSFVGALNSIKSLGARLVGVPLEEDGIDLAALEEALKTEPNVKFLYLIPNFQNPSGITTSLEKRKRILELAQRYGFLVLEDNPYGDLRFEGEHVPAVKSFDENGYVAYVGSFSKVLSPGIRVGYVMAPSALLAKMIVCKQGEDVHTPMWNQMLAEAFMRETDYEAHLRRLQEIYRKKAQLMIDLVEEHLVPAGIAYHPIQGGLFLWCDLPEGTDMPEFCTLAVRDHKVAVVPGNAFLTSPDLPCRSFRMNFSTPTDDAMCRGLSRLGAFAREYL